MQLFSAGDTWPPFLAKTEMQKASSRGQKIHIEYVKIYCQAAANGPKLEHMDSKYCSHNFGVSYLFHQLIESLQYYCCKLAEEALQLSKI